MQSRVFDMIPTIAKKHQALKVALQDIGPRIVACSGGVDSLLLATVAHQANPGETIIAHAISPAVPAAATQRVKDFASVQGWQLQLLESGEFENSTYLSNPVNRCFYCKSHLYEALSIIKKGELGSTAKHYTMLSGANLDDLKEYRPGLEAAKLFEVRHPFVEAQMLKTDIRSMSRALELPSAELPASPCLASRLYTGTRVTAPRLRAVEQCEEFIREKTNVATVRCRIKDNRMLIEVTDKERNRITSTVVDSLRDMLRSINPKIVHVGMDPLPYKSGRAFVGSK